MDNDRPTVRDLASKAIYFIGGILCLGVSGWFLFFVSPFNPYGFWIFLVAGLVLLLSGLGARARDILFFPFP